MALFGFSDISFDTNVLSKIGPLGKLVGSQFEKNTYRYPLDIGNADKGHYLMIYIRQQDRSSFKTGTFAGGQNAFAAAANNLQNKAKAEIQGGLQAAQNKLNTAVGGDLLSKVNTSNLGGTISGFLGDAYNGVVGGINNLFGQTGVTFGGNSALTKSVIDTSIKNITNQSFLKITSLTTDAIALYMPDSLSYTYSQSYDQMELGNELGGKILAAGGSAVDAYNAGKGSDNSMLKGAGAAGQSLGTSARNEVADAFRAGAGGLAGQNTARLGFTAVTGTVRNPMLEMIYKSPNFRTFSFDFVFYPRDEKEALEVQRIVERLRFHQAPELAKAASGFLIPPSEFDIKFYYGGTQNPNIPPISTCVLETINIDYAPNGFSAYEVPNESQPSLGRTGMPVAMKVSLGFKETTYLTKSDFRFNEGNSQAKN
jgi:hypothetical protein